MKKRPSYIEANMNFPDIPSNFIVTFGVFIIVYFASLLIWAICQSNTLETYLWIAGSVLLFIYSGIVILGCIGKCRLTIFQNEMERNQEILDEGLYDGGD